jgi:N-acetylglucosamine-6-phosphate deacetylase
MAVIHGAAVVTPSGVVRDGWVRVHRPRIAEVGSGAVPAATERIDLPGGWLLPGYIDLHVHGGGGHDFAASPDALAAGVAFHLAHGTTSTLVSLVTAPVEALCERLGWIAALAQRGPGPGGQVVGAHLEGPFLARSRCGAQHPEYLLAPDTRVATRLLRAGEGWVRTVTVAPEQPGAERLIAELTEAGVVVAIGHTDATYDQAVAAFAGGASLLTHAFNAMRRPHHREPGPVLAAVDSGAACEVINDGVHVHPATVRLLARTAPVVLVTDAIEAAGCGDGEYALGGRDVRVDGGQARLVEGGALAGSTLTMEEAVRRAVVEVGLPIEVASKAASGHPAGVLGIDHRCGAIAAGLDADLVVLDDRLRVTRVMKQGQWVS